MPQSAAIEDRAAEGLTTLGARIDAKVEEFRKQGILHDATRQEAANFQIRHARVSRAASGDHFTVAGAISDELASDAEILRHTFDRWVAQTTGRVRGRTLNA